MPVVSDTGNVVYFLKIKMNPLPFNSPVAGPWYTCNISDNGLTEHFHFSRNIRQNDIGIVL